MHTLVPRALSATVCVPICRSAGVCVCACVHCVPVKGAFPLSTIEDD